MGKNKSKTKTEETMALERVLRMADCWPGFLRNEVQSIYLCPWLNQHLMDS